jgi:hypothetical protein
MFLYVLIAVAISDPIASHGKQIVGYYLTQAECEKDKQRIYPSTDKNYIKLTCLKVNNE